MPRCFTFNCKLACLTANGETQILDDIEVDVEAHTIAEAGSYLPREAHDRVGDIDGDKLDAPMVEVSILQAKLTYEERHPWDLPEQEDTPSLVPWEELYPY